MAPLVEARRDGRVGERESASLDRHLVACASCRGLAADLERLSNLAGRSSAPSLTPLEQRRERLRLLRDAAFAPASLAGTRSRVQIARFAAAAVMIFGVLAGGTALAVLGLPSVKAGAPDGESAAAIATPPAPPARRILAVPYAATIAAPAAEAPTSSAEAAIADDPPPLIAAPRPASPHAKKGAVAPAGSARAAIAPNEGASALADGVELIERGDYGAAAERLRAFRTSHPTDARAEDAAFLSVLALERAGRHAAAVGAARDYLASYPGGYRRAEAQAIVAAP